MQSINLLLDPCLLVVAQRLEIIGVELQSKAAAIVKFMHQALASIISILCFDKLLLILFSFRRLNVANLEVLCLVHDALSSIRPDKGAKLMITVQDTEWPILEA